MGKFLKNTLLAMGFGFIMLIVLINVVSIAPSAMIPFLFPTLKSDAPDPSQTLTAPFALPKAGPPVAMPSQAQAVPLPEGSVPLDMPHRNSEQIAGWLMTAVSESLTFEKANYQEPLNNAFQYFNDNGKKEYLAFLDQISMIGILQSNKYYIRSFVQETPVLLNAAAIDGRYRWLFEVPVMVSYMDRSMHGYKNAQPVNQMLSIKVQVGRTSDHLTEGKDIVIETWTGRVVSTTKPQ